MFGTNTVGFAVDVSKTFAQNVVDGIYADVLTNAQTAIVDSAGYRLNEIFSNIFYDTVNEVIAMVFRKDGDYTFFGEGSTINLSNPLATTNTNLTFDLYDSAGVAKAGPRSDGTIYNGTDECLFSTVLPLLGVAIGDKLTIGFGASGAVLPSVSTLLAVIFAVSPMAREYGFISAFP